jgi:hypothetical protein
MLRYLQARAVVLLILGAITVQYTISLNILGAGGGRSTRSGTGRSQRQ